MTAVTESARLNWGPLGASRVGLIRRERLASRLLEARGAAVAVVVAPAGYGKTTLLREWEMLDERPFVWLTLTERDNDPARLIGSVAAALNASEPIDEELFAALSSARPKIANVVVPRLCESLLEREQSLALVLDDLHSVHNPEALAPLTAIANCLPWGSQLVLSSRGDPLLPIARLRAHRGLVELHAQELAMTRSEASELLRASGLELSPAAVERLVARTEGWPAALYLAALSLMGEQDLDLAVERFAGDDRMVADYLRDEFISGLDDADFDFLTGTSVLDRLNGRLCDAVLQREGSAETLRRLSRSNLLLVPLDRKDEQYRYHVLLREMLQSELRHLGHDRESKLHERASSWYAEQGDFDRAIPHAISAGDIQAAGRLIWSNTAYYAGRGREETLRKWLDRFTHQQIADSPALCLALAMSHLSRGEGDKAEHWTEAAVRSLDNVPEPERGALEIGAALMLATGAARDGVTRMGEEARRAYGLLPKDDPWRSLCCLLDGAAHHLVGHREAARTALEEGSRRGGVGAPGFKAACLAQLALVEMDEDEMDRAAALALEATIEVDRYGLTKYPTTAFVFAISALIRARRGRIEDAARDAKRATRLLELLTELSPWFEAETRIVLARALLLLDDVATARAHLADAVRYLRQTPDAVVLREWLGAASQEANSAASGNGHWPLTTAELRLLHFLPTHLSFREIAEEVFVSTNTVKTQAQSIYRKLAVSSRAEAVACAQAAGLIEMGDSSIQPPSH